MKLDSHCCAGLGLDGTVKGPGNHTHVPVARLMQQSSTELDMNYWICAGVDEDPRGTGLA